MYEFALTLDKTLCSVFKTAAVILPPKVAASLNLTKSPGLQPWLVSLTVSVEDPFEIAKVTSPAAVVFLTAVTS